MKPVAASIPTIVKIGFDSVYLSRYFTSFLTDRTRQCYQSFKLLVPCSVRIIFRLEKFVFSDKGAFEEAFSFACPKFVSPVAPNYNAGPVNLHKEPMNHQLMVFIVTILLFLMK